MASATLVRVDAYASLRHFGDHLLPIWRALPESVRGTFWAPRDVCAWFPDEPLTEGVPGRTATNNGPVLVAGFQDHHTVRPRPTILVNHGAGQSYAATKGAESFSGGPGRERVWLHVEPGPLAARASVRANHVFAQTGMAFLDPWHANPVTPEPGLICVALHHNGRGAPEQMPAWPHYEAALRDLCADFRVLGHGHPRGWGRVENRWRRWGVPSTPFFSTVLDHASLLITDVSSVGPMFASTGRPVIFLSAPWHLAAPESGGRFHTWTRVSGWRGHVTDPNMLEATVAAALADPQPLVDAQRAIVDEVFYKCDGQSARRAADAIIGCLERHT